MIPDFVLEALASVYTDSEIDMADKDAVVEHLDIVYQEAADWIRSNPIQYPIALEKISDQMNGGSDE